MRIKRLELVGFKSFVDKTLIELPSGITGVVGPNGCGKSNIVDAIRWVLGEQSYKTLRGGAMEDVIFSGSESRSPTGMAEVIITFDNQEGKIGGIYAAHTEISVGRRLFRSGESEYLLNKSPARLKDIQEIFMDTGVGSRAHYAIIEQGKVGLVLSAKAEDRRLLIEEAAGISKYRSRKDAALRKLEATKQNVLRILDVVSEVKRQMDYTNRQAQKAKRYAGLKEELLGLEGKLWKVDYRQQHALFIKRGEDLTALSARDQALKLQMERADLDVEKRRLEMLGAEKAIQTVQERFYANRSRCDLLENNSAHAKKILADLEVRRGADQEQMTKVQAQITEAKVQQKQAQEFLEASAREEAMLQDQLTAAQEAFETALSASKQMEQRQESLREEMSERITKIANGGTSLENCDRRRLEGAARIARTESEIEEFERKLQGLRQGLLNDEEKLQGAQQLQLELKSRAVASQESMASLNQQRTQAESALVVKREHLAHQKSRLSLLQELQANYEGFDEGSRFLLRRKGQGQEQRVSDDSSAEKIFGVVADIVSLPKQYEKAAQAALGERLQYIVVKSHAAGVAAIDYLNAQSAGRSAFIPVEIKDFADDGRRVQGEGVIGPMLDLVKSDPGYEGIVRYLFGRFVVVDNIQNAKRLWAANGNRKTLVTLEGEVLDPYGVVSGGRKSAAVEPPAPVVAGDEDVDAANLLTRKRAIRDLAVAIDASQTEIRGLEDRLEDLAKRLARTVIETESLRKNSHEEELRFVSQQRELQQIRDESARCEDHLARLRGRKAEEEALLEEIRQEQARVAQQILQHKEEKNELARQFERLREETVAVRGTLEAGKEKLTQIQVRGASLREQRMHREETVERLEREMQERVQRIEALSVALERGAQEGAQTQETLGKTGEEIATLFKASHELEVALTRERDAFNQMLASLQQLEDGLRLNRREEEKLAHEISALHVLIAEDKMRMEALERDAKEKQVVALEVLTQEALSKDGQISAEEIAQAREKLVDLRKQMETLGEVNLASIQELEDLTTRHMFLNRQREDLENSMEVLQKTIQKVNRTSRERFRETFDAVNAKFQEIFPRLFAGGKASLLLTNEEDLLETGVDILCQPPGKKIQNVALLSGGEKALASICLILAIFLIKPSPFCLLDEVDAPLDDANISRFNELLRELAKESQLILITHNRNTMEIADYLYGVTMQEPGVSRMVSVRMS